MQSAPEARKDRFPAQVRYIIGNEAAERFSFYGMRSILTVFLSEYLLRHQPAELRSPMARSYFHLFMMAAFFTPLIGGYLSDRFFGKYKTILWLSLVYCAGHACLAVFPDNPSGFYTGLFLIALGSGGIKPCVSAFVGDQFTASNKHLVKKVFAAFYWSINLGSFFASLTVPKTLKLFGPAVAFAIPGVLMLIATLVFWLGRHGYQEFPPTGKNPHSFLRVVASALRAPRQSSGHWLDRARSEHPAAAVEGARAVFRVLAVFAPIPFFWMLFDQKASAWVLQAKQMNLQVGPWTFEPSQLQFINPTLVMLLIPLTTGVIYPAFDRLGYTLKPLRRMTIGMFFAGFSFVLVALIQVAIDGGNRPSVLWQAGPYVVLTLGEILVSTTGLEFAYTQAPGEMKGTIMSFWNLAVAAGNFVVAIISRLNIFTGPSSFLFYAGLVGLAGLALGLIARGYREVEFFRSERPAPVSAAGESVAVKAQAPT